MAIENQSHLKLAQELSVLLPVLLGKMLAFEDMG